jgi:hypothetical protein
MNNASILRALTLFLFLYIVAFVATLRAQTPAKPQYDAWGFDLDGADKKKKPEDDFFRYINKNLKYTNI